MNINTNNRRSVPTLVLSGLGVVAAAITWLSFKQVAANAPPPANPNSRATGEQPVHSSNVKQAQDMQHAAGGVTNFEASPQPNTKPHSE